MSTEPEQSELYDRWVAKARARGVEQRRREDVGSFSMDSSELARLVLGQEACEAMSAPPQTVQEPEESDSETSLAQGAHEMRRTWDGRWSEWDSMTEKGKDSWQAVVDRLDEWRGGSRALGQGMVARDAYWKFRGGKFIPWHTCRPDLRNAWLVAADYVIDGLEAGRK